MFRSKLELIFACTFLLIVLFVLIAKYHQNRNPPEGLRLLSYSQTPVGNTRSVLLCLTNSSLRSFSVICEFNDPPEPFTPFCLLSAEMDSDRLGDPYGWLGPRMGFFRKLKSKSGLTFSYQLPPDRARRAVVRVWCIEERRPWPRLLEPIREYYLHLQPRPNFIELKCDITVSAQN